MNVVSVVSMKGGVGKTSVTANLAAAIAMRPEVDRVWVVDLDPQNALRWHFGFDSSLAEGVSRQSLRGLRWGQVAFESAFNVTCLPYGSVSEEQRNAFEALLADQPHWVGSRLKEEGLAEKTVVLIDTPPGPSVYLNQAFACADLSIIVLLADAGSYLTIPATESWLDEALAEHATVRSLYVLNQVDASSPLRRDLTEVLQHRLGQRLAPVGIHRDQAVREALAFRQPVVRYDQHCQANWDISELATWLIDALNFPVPFRTTSGPGQRPQ